MTLEEKRICMLKAPIWSQGKGSENTAKSGLLENWFTFLGINGGCEKNRGYLSLACSSESILL